MAIFRVAMRSGAEGETKGTLVYNDANEKITLDPPDSELLKMVMKEKLQIFGELIDPTTEPWNFMLNLQKQYRSAYLSADAPKEDGTDIPIRPGPDAGRA